MRNGLLLLGIAVLAFAGCAKNDQKTEAFKEEPYTPPAHDSLDSMDAAPPNGYAASTNYTTSANNASYASPAYTSTASYSSPTPAPAANPSTTIYAGSSSDEVLSPAGGQTYVVKKGDTLYGLARRLYGDQSRWRDIYSANRGRLSSPDSLKVGTELVIP